MGNFRMFWLCKVCMIYMKDMLVLVVLMDKLLCGIVMDIINGKINVKDIIEVIDRFKLDEDYYVCMELVFIWLFYIMEKMNVMVVCWYLKLFEEDYDEFVGDFSLYLEIYLFLDELVVIDNVKSY